MDGTAAFGGASVNGFVATAFAQGGDGQNGGLATAGSSTITINGSLTATGVVQASASAVAGNGVDFGGVAQGGNALILVNGSLQTANLSVVTNGVGGAASTGIGGDGTSGEAILRSFGTLTATGDVLISSYGEGGDGGNGGGQGTGYSAAAPLSGTAQLTGTVTIISTGTGGDGGSGTGGDGFGGYARMSGFQGGTVTANNVTIDFERHWRQRRRRWQWLRKHQRRGLGRIGHPGAGRRQFGEVPGQASRLPTASAARAPPVAGGNGTAGSTFLTAVGAPLTTDAVFLSSDALGGAGASSNGTATAGSAQVVSESSGTITAAGLILAATGDLGTGSVDISVDAGSTVAAGDLALISSSDLNVPLIGTNITVTGLLDLESDGNINFTDVTAGALEFSAGGTVNGGNVNVADYVDGQADGAMTLGDITAGPGLPTTEGLFGDTSRERRSRG